MKVRFFNPVGQVSGSCCWLKDDDLGVELLVDCGMAQGEHDAPAWNARGFQFDPAKLTAVLLTHAHLDHCGLLPRLVKPGFKGPIWCTRETAELARLSLLDAAGQRDALYSERDVEALNFREPNGQVFGRLHPLAHDVFFAFYRSSHIVGGVSIQIRWGPKPVEGMPSGQRAITFSGDLGSNEEGREHLPLPRHRMNPFAADYAVIESTYGATTRPPEHHDFDARIERLRAAIDRGLFERQEHVLIPCFAIDRTQTVLFDLHYIIQRDPERYAGVPIFLNAPQAAAVNAIYAKALVRKESIKANQLRPIWMNKRLFNWLALERTADGEQRLEAALTRMFVGSQAGQNNNP